MTIQFKIDDVITTTILIDAQGQELGRLVGPAEWDDSEMVSFLRSFTE